MLKRILYAMVIAAAVISCSSHGDSDADKEEASIDTIPQMIMQIQQCSRLYTAEYDVHKIVTHGDDMRIQGRLLSHDYDVKLPMADRRIAIPMDVTLKAYIDFRDFSDKNVVKSGKKITIILPDPKVTLTSSKIDQRGVKAYVDLARTHFTDAEMSNYERQGRDAVIKSIPELGIVALARDNAARTLIPMIKHLGYDEADITITFRKDFNPADITHLLDNTTITNARKD